MADAPSSGGGELTLVEVRLLSSASKLRRWGIQVVISATRMHYPDAASA
jgi:hypothetical protein